MTRTIDADALSKVVSEATLFVKDAEFFKKMIESAPTIHPSGRPALTEEVREALMRLTMCAREECKMCKYQHDCGFEKQYEMATENMHTILNAFKNKDGLTMSRKEIETEMRIAETQKTTQISNLRKCDYIRRKDAINAFDRGRLYHKTGIAEVLEALPSVAEWCGEWIPCSRRLPEDGEIVLVSLRRYNKVDIDHRLTGYDGVTYWYDWEGYVIAWMPLPKPEKTKGDEK